MATVKEIWKPIVGYEGLYEVSNLGNVRSLDRYVKGKRDGFPSFVKGKQLTPILNCYGYFRVNLCNSEGRKSKFIHQLVCSAFLDNPNNYNQINHKDETRTNNNLDNLEWCDAKYNANYGTRNQRLSVSTSGVKKNFSKKGLERIKLKNSKPIIGTNIFTGEEIQFSSISSTKQSGFCSRSVSECLSNKKKTYKGYLWRYKYANGRTNNKNC